MLRLAFLGFCGHIGLWSIVCISLLAAAFDLWLLDIEPKDQIVSSAQSPPRSGPQKAIRS